MTINLRFPGQYYDEETKLDYNWHRYYNPETGRYVSSDPMGLGGGANTYAYIVNNPSRFLDLPGLDLTIINGIPSNSVIYQAPDGEWFYAPPRTQTSGQ